MWRTSAVASAFIVSAIPGALALGEPLRVSLRDLSLQPHRVYGKDIEVRLHCAAVGQDQYRCAEPGLRLDLVKIVNDEGRDKIQRACNGAQEVTRRKCLFTLRFISEGGRRDSRGIVQIRARDDSAEIVMSGAGTD